MSSSAVARHFNAVAEVFADTLEQGSAPLRISAAHATQMTLVHPAGYEFGERLLLERRRVAVREPLGRRQGAYHRLRRNNIANPECREDGTGERADVDHTSAIVEAMQRLQRLSF